MSALLQAQLDAEPTIPSDDFSDIMNPQTPIPTVTYAEQKPVQPSLQVKSDDTHQAILQRLSELEDMVKDGFDKISSKLSNTAITAVSQKGGKRRTTRKRRSKMRSKQSMNVY